MTTAGISALLSQTKALADAIPAIRNFVGDALTDMGVAQSDPRHLDAVDLMLSDPMRPSSRTAALTNQVIAARDEVRWSHSYTAEQVGADFLSKSCWFNLVSPDGPYVHQNCRVSFGYWHQGLTYPEHRHEPEEVYCVLAGGASFHAKGRASVIAGPGDVIHHPPNITHSIEMADQSLLVVAFWRGAHLTRRSAIGAEL